MRGKCYEKINNSSPQHSPQTAVNGNEWAVQNCPSQNFTRAPARVLCAELSVFASKGVEKAFPCYMEQLKSCKHVSA